MIVWGGNASAPGTGGRYNPTTDQWTATSLINAPVTRGSAAGAWNGAELIVWTVGQDTGGIGARLPPPQPIPGAQSARSKGRRRPSASAVFGPDASSLSGAARTFLREEGAPIRWTRAPDIAHHLRQPRRRPFIRTRPIRLRRLDNPRCSRRAQPECPLQRSDGGRLQTAAHRGRT